MWKIAEKVLTSHDNITGVPSGTVKVAQSAEYTIKEAVPTHAEYVFVGWYHSKKKTTFVPGSKFIMPGKDVTLTAQWRKAPPTYSVTYVAGADGATGLPTYATGLKAGAAYEVESNTPARTGYSFLNWKDKESGQMYDPSDKLKILPRDVTLVAQWVQNI